MKVRYQHQKNQLSENDSEIDNVSLEDSTNFVHRGTKALYLSIKKGIDEVQAKDVSSSNGYALLETLAVVSSEVIQALALAAKKDKKFADSNKADIADLQSTMETIYDNYLWSNLKHRKLK